MNKSFEQLAHGRGGDLCRIRYHCRLYVPQRRGIPFICEPSIFIWCKHLGSRSLEVNAVSADQAGRAWSKDGDTSIDSVQLVLRVTGQQYTAVDDGSQKVTGDTGKNEPPRIVIGTPEDDICIEE